MVSWPQSVAHRVLRGRASLPRWVNRGIDHVADHPDGLVGRIAARSLGSYGPQDVPAPSDVPRQPIKVYIGPTNYAGQARAWARALEAASPEVGARNLAVAVPGGFSFATDREVPIPVHANDRGWQTRELAAVSQFTHVLFESGKPLFGRYFSRDVEAEARELADRGLSTAFMSHGTEVRLPSAHRELTPFSPYRDTDVYHDRHERLARRWQEFLQRLDRPTFVSTPDLLLDLPWARWCPVVVDPSALRSSTPVGTHQVPVVVHAPSQSTIKGTHLIRPAMRRLHERGVIEYRELSGVPSAQMPAAYASADIVLDQFRLGSYGVAACEAMAASRVVVGHIVDSVRQTVRQSAGQELPIVEATVETIEDVVLSLIEDPERLAASAEAGRQFVELHHDGRRSAQVLRESWVVGQ